MVIVIVPRVLGICYIKKCSHLEIIWTKLLVAYRILILALPLGARGLEFCLHVLSIDVIHFFLKTRDVTVD